MFYKELNQLPLYLTIMQEYLFAFQPTMSDPSPSISDTVLGSAPSSTGVHSSSWLPFCVGTATGAVLFGGAMLAWQHVKRNRRIENEISEYRVSAKYYMINGNERRM